jgi:hypothetical protein
MPWTDWQFWTVTAAAIVAACFVLRPMLPSRPGGGSCRGCPADGAPAKPRRATLTIEGHEPGEGAPRRD